MKSQIELEIENAELRGQVKALREMIEKLMTKPVAAPIQIPMPCTRPHRDEPNTVWPNPHPPFIWRDGTGVWKPNGYHTIAGATCVANPTGSTYVEILS